MFDLDAIAVSLSRAGLLAQDAPNPGMSMLPLFIIGALFLVMVIMPQRRERQARQAMIAELKKNDRVVTTFGVYGTVASIRPEKDQVSIKVDESSNTELKMSLSAIARVIVDEPPKTPPAA